MVDTHLDSHTTIFTTQEVMMQEIVKVHEGGLVNLRAPVVVHFLELPERARQHMPALICQPSTTDVRV